MTDIEYVVGEIKGTITAELRRVDDRISNQGEKLDMFIESTKDCPFRSGNSKKSDSIFVKIGLGNTNPAIKILLLLAVGAGAGQGLEQLLSLLVNYVGH